jgi:replicative DNA helicase
MSWPADKPVPNNPDAERAVVAALMLNPEYLPAIVLHLSEDQFFDQRHRKIFRAELLLAAQQRPIDILTVTALLEQQGELESVGGASYVASVIDGVPHVQNVAHYAAIVRDAAVRRNFITVCDEFQSAAETGRESGNKLLERGCSKFIEMLSAEGNSALHSPWRDAVTAAMGEIVESFHDPGSVMRLKFGIPGLDEITSGLRRQDLVLIVGQTSHGKTGLAMQLATNADSSGYRGLILSAEMSKEALAKRELAHTARVPLYQTRRPELVRDPKRLLDMLTEAAASEAKRRLVVVDRDITPLRVKVLCELVRCTSGLDFVIVDYDQLVVRAGLKRPEEEFAHQARFVSDALALAKRLNICFILLCQPRKVDHDVARGKRNPRVEEIFGHSAAGNTAHHVLWVMRRYFQKDMDPAFERDAVVHVLKARNDKPASV